MMKFSLKHGFGLLAGLFLSSAALASEPVPSMMMKFSG
jgi:hypothetical protein